MCGTFFPTPQNCQTLFQTLFWSLFNDFSNSYKGWSGPSQPCSLKLAGCSCARSSSLLSDDHGADALAMAPLGKSGARGTLPRSACRCSLAALHAEPGAGETVCLLGPRAWLLASARLASWSSSGGGRRWFRHVFIKFYHVEPLLPSTVPSSPSSCSSPLSTSSRWSCFGTSVVEPYDGALYKDVMLLDSSFSSPWTRSRCTP